MVRFAATSLLAWAGTLSFLGALAVRLDLPEGDFIRGAPIPVAWTLATGDPVSFGIMLRNLQTDVILRIIPVQNTVPPAQSGSVIMKLDVLGQVVLTPIQQLVLASKEQPISISPGRQVNVVQTSGSSGLPSSSSATTPLDTSSTSSPPPDPTTLTQPPPTSSSPVFLAPTSSPTLSFPIGNSRSISVSTIFSTSVAQPSSDTTFSFETSFPTSGASNTSSGLSSGKKITMAMAILGSLIGLLLCILLLLHYQRRRANRRRINESSDNWTRRRQQSISKSVLDFQSSSAVSSFSAGVADLEKTQNQTELQSVENGRYPATNTMTPTQIQGRDRVLPPISIPQTYLTPPSPRAMPMALANPDSPGNSYSPSYMSPLSSNGMNSPGIMININSPSPTSSSHHLLPSPSTPLTPFTPSTPTTGTPGAAGGQVRSRKMREVLEIQAQRKLMREEQELRMAFARNPGARPAPGLNAVGEGDRDSWAVILNDEPLPRYVSPAASVRLLS